MIVAGIDPGKSGALAILKKAHGETLLSIHRVPLIKFGDKKGKVDFLALKALWQPALQFVEFILVERVAARPGQGVVSMFNFGFVSGYMAGLVPASIPGAYVTPQKWKKFYCLSGLDKSASRSVAARFFKGVKHEFARVKDDGPAEAALIARYAYEHIGEYDLG